MVQTLTCWTFPDPDMKSIHDGNEAHEFTPHGTSIFLTGVVAWSNISTFKFAGQHFSHEADNVWATN